MHRAHAAFRLAVLLVLVVGGLGCRLKSVESYKSIHNDAKPTGFADKYTYGGMADATGGLKTKTRIGSGNPVPGYVAPEVPIKATTAPAGTSTGGATGASTGPVETAAPSVASNPR